ncbi:MAG TPA: hypothetical protein VM532_14735 [Burkholderiales bacterium]|nr:hypothetical protein [Burkholderiales bacterium]
MKHNEPQEEERLIRQAFWNAWLIQMGHQQSDTAPISEINHFLNEIIRKYQAARQNATPALAPSELLSTAFWETKEEIMRRGQETVLSVEELELPKLFISIHEVLHADISPQPTDEPIESWEALRTQDEELRILDQLMLSVGYVKEHLDRLRATSSPFPDQISHLETASNDVHEQFIVKSRKVIEARMALLLTSDQKADDSELEIKSLSEEGANAELLLKKRTALIELKSDLLREHVKLHEQMNTLRLLLEKLMEKAQPVNQTNAASPDSKDTTQASKAAVEAQGSLEHDIWEVRNKMLRQAVFIKLKREALTKLERENNRQKLDAIISKTHQQTPDPNVLAAMARVKLELMYAIEAKLESIVLTQTIPNLQKANILSLPDDQIKTTAVKAAQDIALKSPLLTQLFNQHRNDVMDAVSKGLKKQIKEVDLAKQVVTEIFHAQQPTGVLHEAIAQTLENTDLIKYIKTASQAVAKPSSGAKKKHGPG